MSGIVKTMPSLKYDVSSAPSKSEPLDATSLEELIKKYNDDRDCFTKKRISDVEFNKMQTTFVGKYLDQKKNPSNESRRIRYRSKRFRWSDN